MITIHSKPRDIHRKRSIIRKKLTDTDRRLNTILKRQKVTSVMQHIISGKEMLTGQRIIIDVLTGIWMTIKPRCDMPRMQMKQLPIICGKPQTLCADKINFIYSHSKLNRLII